MLPLTAICVVIMIRLFRAARIDKADKHKLPASLHNDCNANVNHPSVNHPIHVDAWHYHVDRRYESKFGIFLKI